MTGLPHATIHMFGRLDGHFFCFLLLIGERGSARLLPDGKIVLLNHLKVGQRAKVLQLPVTQGVKVPGPKSAKV